MGGSTTAHLHAVHLHPVHLHPVHLHPANGHTAANPVTVAPSSWSVAASTRRRVGLTLAVVGAFAATVVVLSVTSTVVARLG
jgi:hypothetical protein